ncbi:MAG: asparaginase [Synergistaceae bacterium]|jgi:L-asparaginase|nr:asparaginase [Synergistaceae bacterium]
MTKKILVISTGGTIVSQIGEGGLAPTGGAGGIVDVLRGRFPEHDISLDELMSLDSSNVGPRHWRDIARAVWRALPNHDGVIITHGTDTMAYTASALAFMLRGLRKGVVLTGSQIPSFDPLSDAASNLCVAASALLCGITGVTIAFGRKVINGARAVKVSSTDMDAFDSPNAPPIASVTASGVKVTDWAMPKLARCGVLTVLEDELCGDVFLLKLTPGTKLEMLAALPDMGYRGVVIEAFGAGGAPDAGCCMKRGLYALAGAHIPVVVRSQCLTGGVDLSMYETGRTMREMGAISARDMTSEAAVTKLMWALGRTSDVSEIRKIFETNLAGEISI